MQNDYAGEWASNFEPPAQFLQQRAAAYQAFYEHMPLRPQPLPGKGGRDADLRSLCFGDLVSFSMLDGRQYRSREACYAPPYGGGHVVTAQQCPELIDPARSMLGEAQESWLYDGLAQSQRPLEHHRPDRADGARCTTTDPGTEAHEWTEAWDGYPAARTRLLDHIQSSGVANPVVLSGDNHAFWANELKREADGRHDRHRVRRHLDYLLRSALREVAKWLPANPQVKFFESRKRGYALGGSERRSNT